MRMSATDNHSFALSVDGWSAMDIFVHHFVPPPPNVATHDEQYFQVMHPGWKNVEPAMPLSMVFPTADCEWYGGVLKNACPRHLKDYVLHMYDEQGLHGPTTFSSGSNAGYDDKKMARIIQKKRNTRKKSYEVKYYILPARIIFAR